MTKPEDKIFNKAKQRSIAYRDTFKSDLGLHVLYDIMLHSFMMRSTFSKDPYETAFNEGQRNMCLKILHEVGIDIKELENKLRKANDHGRDSFE